MTTGMLALLVKGRFWSVGANDRITGFHPVVAGLR
jgi:hypothetical protein